MEYDVSWWLANVEAHISSQNITLEGAKIKEAWVLVCVNRGNARAILNGAMFTGISTFVEVKAECLLIWKPSAKADTLLIYTDS